jgi:lysozyme family protein
MQTLKQKTIEGIIAVEGGYVNDPADSGGETNFGVTIAVARANGYEGSMIDMPKSVAFDIYATQYWDAMSGDELVELSEAVATEVIDTAVNMGTGRAGRFLQRSLNVLSKGESLKVDGQVGPATVRALRSYLWRGRDEKTLVKALDCLQGAFYIELAERREKDERFVYGWLKHRVGV